MALHSLGDALKHIYQLAQPKIQEENGNKTASVSTPNGLNTTAVENNTDLLSSDSMSLRRMQGLNPLHKKVTVNDYKDAVGRDKEFVKETLRNKLSELGLPAHTKIDIRKNEKGDLVAEGALLPEHLEQINRDLNNNKAFRAAFLRLSVNQPTLDYVDNVVNLSKAYGADNNLFGSLLSGEKENNNLTDIANRFEKLKSTYMSDPLAAANSVTENKDFHFSINA